LKKQAVVFVWGLLIFFGCAGTGPQKDTLQFVSVEEELALGKSLSMQATQQLDLIRNQKVNEFFNALAKEIGSQSDWDGLLYFVHIVNDPHLNHFSLPGGHIYIFRGLVEFASSTSEIASIVAHEIAHLASRDGVDRVAIKYAYAFAAQSVLGEIDEIPQQIISNLYSDGSILDYTNDDEFFADQRCIKYLWKTNYDPNGFATILEKLRTVQNENPESILLLQSTHPPISDRFKKAFSQIRKTPRKNSLRKDTPEFKEILSILGQIPH
jgi:beta-barrel assembly-enhancing protease